MLSKRAMFNFMSKGRENDLFFYLFIQIFDIETFSAKNKRNDIYVVCQLLTAILIFVVSCYFVLVRDAE